MSYTPDNNPLSSWGVTFPPNTTLIPTTYALSISAIIQTTLPITTSPPRRTTTTTTTTTLAPLVIPCDEYCKKLGY